MEVLVHRFRVIAFDWDGTAVSSRADDGTPIRLRIEHLLQAGVYVVVITGTNFPNVNRQATDAIHGPFKQRLLVCTNRGSEVWGFGSRSQPKIIWNRVASEEENRRLTAIAERLRATIQRRTALPIEIVYDRVNRRKIDLIPLPEWRDPPKSKIGDLLHAVQERLIGTGITGGLREVLQWTRELAYEEGLPEARITSDVKHIEVGLTDKGDSIEWMMREVVRKEGIPIEDVLIGGDEFGPIDGMPGSDYMMVRPGTKGSAVVSVGPEPNGVPTGVTHLGGGPDQFLKLLDQQYQLWRVARVPIVVKEERERAREEGWLMIEEGFNPAREHEFESIFSVGNGYLGSRSTVAEGTPNSRPGTFVAGIFDVPTAAYSVPGLVKGPDWARLRISVDGEQLSLDEDTMLEHRRILDMRRGTLLREWRHRDAVGRVTKLNFRRFASLADRHALAESLSIIPENYGAEITVESALEGDTDQPNISYLPPSSMNGREAIALCVHECEVHVAFGLATGLRNGAATARHQTVKSDASLVHRLQWQAQLGQEYQVDKFVTVYTTRDSDEPVREAVDHAAALADRGFDTMQKAHEQAWAEHWRRSDVDIDGDPQNQRAVRFAIYHLVSAANPLDDRVSIGARGLTGEAYKGHVFWDTEIFMLPFYSFTNPETARGLLRYRYNSLSASRARARKMGYRGALYAWESTLTGEDVTPSLVVTPNGEMIRILCGEIEHHISADVAYAVWQYWQATGDERFLQEAGAEIILETARFWASRAQLGADDRYHIRHVIGPDEYHEGVDDNAYTNVMAQWNLEQAFVLAGLVRQRWPKHWASLKERIQLERDELNQWADVAKKMHIAFDPKTKLFEQHAGFFDLDYVNLAEYEPRTAPLDVILGRKVIQRSQVIKQADVVMLMYLLWDRFPPEVREANFRYYEPRCDHGSSLSPAIHAAVAARLGDLALASRYFRQSAEIDLANNMGNAALGVHMAAQGGLWQAVVFGFAGMRLREDGLAFDPRLAAQWRSLRVPVQWHGRGLRLVADSNAMAEVALEWGDPMLIELDGRPAAVEAGKAASISRSPVDEEVA